MSQSDQYNEYVDRFLSIPCQYIIHEEIGELIVCWTQKSVVHSSGLYDPEWLFISTFLV